MSGRPRTIVGTYGSIHVVQSGRRRFTAYTRYRDTDGRLRQVKATSTSHNNAVSELKTRLLTRPGYGRGGMLSLTSPFGDLVELWLADLALRELSEGTKKNYRDDVRVHVRPFFDNYTLGEITTGRVESFLKAERWMSYSRAKHSRTMLNLLFGFALRHDAMARNPVEGTSPLRKPKGSPEALTLDQIQRIRTAASLWRTGPAVKGPKPDDNVRDALEVLLGTGLRPGEALALRPVDIQDGREGMVAHVHGTVVYRQGSGTFRQDHPKTDASVRTISVPDFAAGVIRRRLKEMVPSQTQWTIFHNRTGCPISLHNFRRTFRELLVLADLADSGITPRWYRRTGATVIARGIGVDAAATHVGHTSTAITEAHYIEPGRTIDFGPALVLDRTLRPDAADDHDAA
ncbi:MAG: tyrosine-type recombinase/integrase [Nocardioides sp.]|uniref:tyrosine-type recombinase/integrase n=1 Tax=Nocardioides sp. TaxID=35761 RepID=UPI003263E582